MKKISILALLMCCASVMWAQSSLDDKFKEADKIVENIKKTSFPNAKFNIKDFGAVEGDEKKLNHEAIDRAIIECTTNGGGSVIIPKGVWYTGPITLKSNVNLHLEEGAELRFTTDDSYYYPAVKTRWEGLDCYNAHPLIYAYGETNIAVTGKGIIDGQGAPDKWWYMKGKRFNPDNKYRDQEKDGGRDKLLAYAETFTPVDRRQMKAEDCLRPQLINFYNCKSVLIEDVTLQNPPFWVIHPLFCNDLIVRSVTINSGVPKGATHGVHAPNGDGCDPESCKNVLIENCQFNTGDDCIAIKSGRNADGRKRVVPSENIVVRNCKMNDGHGGVVVGSEISGGFRNLYVENCQMDSPNLDRVIRIKTSNCRGGVIENIYVRNIEVGECGESVMRINLQYENKEKCDRSFPPSVRNVYLENVTCKKAQYGLQVNGLSDDDNVYNINMTNCTFDNIAKDNYKCDGKFHDINLTNVKMNGKNVKFSNVTKKASKKKK